jgi:hypothetical protein
MDDVAVKESTTAYSREHGQGDEDEGFETIDVQSVHLLSLEPEVLKRLGGAPVQLRGQVVLSAPHR